MDINNRTSIRIAADVTHSMSVNKDVVDRLKTYVNNKKLDADKRMSLEDALMMEEDK